MVGHGVVAVLGNLVPKLLRYAALIGYADGVLLCLRAVSYGIHNWQRKVYNLARAGAYHAAVGNSHFGRDSRDVGAVGQGNDYCAKGLVYNAVHAQHAEGCYLRRCYGRSGRNIAAARADGLAALVGNGNGICAAGKGIVSRQGVCYRRAEVHSRA